MTRETSARMCAGIPAVNNTLFWRIQFPVGDPAALLEIPDGDSWRSVLILRDIEMARARRHARADTVHCPADFPPEGGLSGDRETATAQAAAECLHRAGIDEVVADRTLPLIFAEMLRRAGIRVHCDTELWVAERRQKSEEEIAHLRESQRVTEEAMCYACERIAGAEAGSNGTLHHDGAPLTANRVRSAIDHFLMDRGFVNPRSIVACGPQGADCHEYGSGTLMTGQPVIVDIFPRSRTSLYCGDCTRTVVHGEICDEVRAMHRAVQAAKAAAIACIAEGVTGEAVHRATIAAIEEHGYEIGLPPDDAPSSYCALTHGTGHGVGLEVHEPPLLDFGGPELLAGDVVTVEPGLYRRDLGGVRLEDLVVVTASGCSNLNRLREGLTWI